MTKSIEGIIIEIAFPRAYWKNSINEGRTPPNCSSHDGVKATVNPAATVTHAPSTSGGPP